VATLYSPYRRIGRAAGLAALAVTATLLAPGTSADAAPKPSVAATKKKLEKLNSQVDKLVDKYNKAKSQLDAAKKELKILNGQLAAEQRTYQSSHARVAQIAAAAYKNGTLDYTTSLLAAKDPNAALSQMSAFTQLTNSRSQELKALVDSAQRLRREQALAQNAFQAVNEHAQSVKKQKATVEKAINQQKELLRKAGVLGGSTGPIGGGTYTGPASGPPRKALDYAYAQLGKPYIYGGTGPKGYDCSGLTMMAWRAAGVSLPRIVPEQYAATRHVAKSALEPGDLVYFDGFGHEGMYVGGGKFLHAPHTGSVVKIDSMSNSWYVSHYEGASRP
jgi:cell wall-associated NlpC family hydrolase